MKNITKNLPILFPLVLALVLVPALTACGGKGAPQTTSGSAVTGTGETGSADATQAAAGTVTGTDEAGSAAAGQDTAKETGAVQGSSAEDPEVSAGDMNTALQPVEFELDEYIRFYPGLNDEDVRFVGSAEMLRILSPGYEALQGSLDELNEYWKLQTDTMFQSQARDLASASFSNFAMDMLPFTSERWPRVSRADSAAFCFGLSESSWFGGAHPIGFEQGFNFDSISGRKLKLRDVVTNYDAFCEEVLRSLEAYPYRDGFFEGWQDTVREALSETGGSDPNWLLTGEGLRIWFNPYEIAPYAIGTVTLDFPRDTYAGLLEPAFFRGEIPEVTDKNLLPYDATVHVYRFCNESGSVETGDGYPADYSYVLPKIYGPETDYTREINEASEELRSSLVDPELQRIQAGEEPVIRHIGFRSQTWKGVTSVLLIMETPTDDTDYRCWNLHEDGTPADNEEILALFGLTPATFAEAARNELSAMVDWDLDEADTEMAAELRRMREDTLSAENCNADMPLFFTNNRGLGFIGGCYTPAGAGYYEDEFRIPGTDHRPDGLTQISLTPVTEENFVPVENGYEIRDYSTGEVCTLTPDTTLIEGLPCYDDPCDAVTWLQRYLDHPARGEATDDSYSLSGFAPGDIWTVLTEDDGHISVVQEIGYWD